MLARFGPPLMFRSRKCVGLAAVRRLFGPVENVTSLKKHWFFFPIENRQLAIGQVCSEMCAVAAVRSTFLDWVRLRRHHFDMLRYDLDEHEDLQGL